MKLLIYYIYLKYIYVIMHTFFLISLHFEILIIKFHFIYYFPFISKKRTPPSLAVFYTSF